MRALLILLSLLLVAGCGQKGALVAPDEAPAPAVEPAADDDDDDEADAKTRRRGGR